MDSQGTLMVGNRHCPACCRVLPAASFSPSQLAKHGARARCKDCTRSSERDRSGWATYHRCAACQQWFPPDQFSRSQQRRGQGARCLRCTADLQALTGMPDEDTRSRAGSNSSESGSCASPLLTPGQHPVTLSPAMEHEHPALPIAIANTACPADVAHERLQALLGSLRPEEAQASLQSQATTSTTATTTTSTQEPLPPSTGPFSMLRQQHQQTTAVTIAGTLAEAAAKIPSSPTGQSPTASQQGPAYRRCHGRCRRWLPPEGMVCFPAAAADPGAAGACPAALRPLFRDTPSWWCGECLRAVADAAFNTGNTGNEHNTPHSSTAATPASPETSPAVMMMMAPPSSSTPLASPQLPSAQFVSFPSFPVALQSQPPSTTLATHHHNHPHPHHQHSRGQNLDFLLQSALAPQAAHPQQPHHRHQPPPQKTAQPLARAHFSSAQGLGPQRAARVALSTQPGWPAASCDYAERTTPHNSFAYYEPDAHPAFTEGLVQGQALPPVGGLLQQPSWPGRQPTAHYLSQALSVGAQNETAVPPFPRPTAAGVSANHTAEGGGELEQSPLLPLLLQLQQANSQQQCAATLALLTGRSARAQPPQPPPQQQPHQQQHSPLCPPTNAPGSTEQLWRMLALLQLSSAPPEWASY